MRRYRWDNSSLLQVLAGSYYYKGVTFSASADYFQ